MKSIYRSAVVLLVLPCLVSTSSFAQQRPGAAPKQGDAGRMSVVRSFERSAPAVGALVPDVKGYTADGKPFSMRDLKGQYTVLVFGCLT
ncbi:MAG: hypothetical protein D6725_11510 [Planctomycetota bacterium]|nr:MAG: hypothetical protein D6725_11510 [Planctomycetota bacterium]